MNIEFARHIYYSNKDHLSVREIAEALLALEKVANPVGEVIEALYDDVVYQSLRIELDELQSGSLSERVRFYLRLAFQKHVEKEAGIEFKSLEGEQAEKKANIAGWALAVVVLFGAKAAADRVWPTKPKQHIDQQINLTLQAGRDITGIEVEKLRTAVQRAIADDPSAIKGAVGFARPAKSDDRAAISIDDAPFLPPEAIAEIPSGMQDEEPQEKVIELEGVEIYIRATDRDSGKRGWGATIPAYSDKRIRLHVAPGIDLIKLAHCDVVIGDVAIFYSVDGNGNISKPHAHLYSVDLDKTDAVQG